MDYFDLVLLLEDSLSFDNIAIMVKGGFAEMVDLLFDISLDKVDAAWSNDGSDIGKLQLAVTRTVNHIAEDPTVLYAEPNDEFICSNDDISLIACKYLLDVGKDVWDGQGLLRWSEATVHKKVRLEYQSIRVLVRRAYKKFDKVIYLLC